MRPNILMVHNYYQIGGGEHTVFEQEAELLRRHGHPVTAYTRHNDELKGSSVKKALLPFQTLFSLKTYREVRRLIRRERIDVVHCHNTFPLISPSVYYAARREGVPVVQAIHNFRLICANALLFRDGHVCEECLSGKMCIRDRLQIVASGNLPYNLAALGKREMGVFLNLKLDCQYDGMRYIPLFPKLESHTVLAWKKNQTMSPVASAFVSFARKYIHGISDDKI